MLFVAEIGLNYDGNFHIAYEMIRQAKLTGADIVKFQFGWRNKPDEINFIDHDRALQLKKWCDYWEVEMLASIITEDALDLVHSIGLQRYKIASRTVIDNPALCKRILSEGKETFVSLGMWEEREFPFGKPEGRNLRYIYCRSKYPTYPYDLVGLPNHFDPFGYFGYSDHLHGIEACLLAIARGAQYIEKHLTLNKTSQVIRDHILSATPEEFKRLTEIGRALAKLVQVIERQDLLQR
jgi:N,N'-diacetyllegionaminate synthase